MQRPLRSIAVAVIGCVSLPVGAQTPTVLWTRPMDVPSQGIDITAAGDRIVVGGGFLSCGGFPGSFCFGEGGFTILDAVSGDVLRVEMPYEFGLNDVAFSPKGDQVALAVGSADVRQSSDGELLASFSAFSGSTHQIHFTADGQRIIAGITSGWESGVRVFDVAGGEQTNTFATVDFASALARSGDGHRIAVADDNLVVWVYDITNPDSEQLLRIFENPNPVQEGDPDGATPFIFDLALSFDGQLVATMSDQRIKVWRVSDGALLHTLESDQTFRYPFLGEFFRTAEISPDGSTLVAGGYETDFGTRGTLNVWNLNDGTLAAHFESTEVFQDDVRDTVFSPDSATIYLATATFNSISGAAVAIANPVADSASACAADIAPQPDGNNGVDVDDMVGVITHWGPCGTSTCWANIVNSGTSANQVDVDDLLAVILQWGPCP